MAIKNKNEIKKFVGINGKGKQDIYISWTVEFTAMCILTITVHCGLGQHEVGGKMKNIDSTCCLCRCVYSGT